jgi:hypothetical protein
LDPVVLGALQVVFWVRLGVVRMGEMVRVQVFPRGAHQLALEEVAPASVEECGHFHHRAQMRATTLVFSLMTVYLSIT